MTTGQLCVHSSGGMCPGTNPRNGGGLPTALFFPVYFSTQCASWMPSTKLCIFT